jgi:hypothetical protein
MNEKTRSDKNAATKKDKLFIGGKKNFFKNKKSGWSLLFWLIVNCQKNFF